MKDFVNQSAFGEVTFQPCCMAKAALLIPGDVLLLFLSVLTMAHNWE